MTTAIPAPVALTCGDPSGIGPEIAAAAWGALKDELCFFWIGDPRHLPVGTPTVVIDAPEGAPKAMQSGLPVLEHAFPEAAPPGRPRPRNAKSVAEVIERAVSLAMAGSASAVCTAPIAKKELADHAGFAFPGHTEFLASLTGAPRAVMMLASEELRVVPVTIHIPLASVPTVLTAELLTDTIRIVANDMGRHFGLRRPRIAVAGLNPHAGEGGLLGQEDEKLIRPVLDGLRADGFDVAGPLPADTMFHAAARTRFDVAIAMYHDQALIPIKTLAFDRGVNVTLGLPMIRTSPDHGTAFDIAGQGKANPTSLIEALRLAWRMTGARTA